MPVSDARATMPEGQSNGRRTSSESILAAGRRLVARKGEDFTTQELIKEAGVALQTFYRYFGGKDQLLLAVLADLISGHCSRLAQEAESLEGPVERFRLYVIATIESPDLSATGAGGPRFVTSQHWRLHQQFPDEMAAAMQLYTDLVRSALEEGRAAGLLTPRDTERDAWLVTRIVLSTFHHYAFAPQDPTLATAAEDVWQFCLAAVGGTPAQRRARRGLFRR